MCTSSKSPPAAPPPPAASPTYVDKNVQGAYGDEKRRQRATAGRKSTILTQGSALGGDTGKTILGG